MQKTFETTLRVRYAETDAMGVVYYGNYFVWFEVVRTEFLRSVGASYRKLEEGGFRLVVADAFCRYRSPCRYDDLVTVKTWVSEVRNTSMVFEYRISACAREIATGRTTHVLTDPSFKPVKLPHELKARIAT